MLSRTTLRVTAIILLFTALFISAHPALAEPSSCDKALIDLQMVNFRALRMAVSDLSKTFPDNFSNAAAYTARLDKYESQFQDLQAALRSGDEKAIRTADAIIALKREILLANPLLDFDRMLVIKRKPIGDARRASGDLDNDKSLGKFLGMPQQSSWQLHTMPNTDGWDNEIAIISDVTGKGRLKTLYRPTKGRLINEMDLHFNGDKVMFSMPDQRKLWQIHEIGLNGKGLHQISPDNQPDVHNLDSCYLPNGRIAYVSTAPFQGVPCNASVNVGMLYLMDADGSSVRQICYEQDHNFCPTVMNDGRIMYLRWEYTDIPHVWARFLFTMNPDGTTQREFYGSGGYWPNGIWFARPIPNHPTKFVGIVTGHHVGRVGELTLFDAARGRNQTDGVIQRIPGYGKEVEPLIEDKLAVNCWPKFLHPWPLSDKYFLVACKPRPNDLWGIYLVDIYDNIQLLKEVEDYALLEPIPVREIPRPPVVPDKVDLTRKDAIVYIEDVYKGPGLAGVPRGTVKKLRLFTYHFAYHRIAGINHRVGADGPWEPKRVLGTVPVEEDGSAMFRVPANMPISIQPLDENNRALQLMRSWMTAMPGETVSCVGCHEKQSAGPPARLTIASRKLPVEIEPWYGPLRGFSFHREVQPVLDKYCVGCHDGSVHHGRQLVDLRGDQGKFIAYRNGNPRAEIIEGVPREELVKKYGGVFEPSYITLRGLVRVGGLESDLRLLDPGEYSADNTKLVQMLRKGHHGVVLDDESWDRIVTWIDLNAPCHGTWSEIVGLERTAKDHARRRSLRELYGGISEDPESYPQAHLPQVEPVMPKPVKRPVNASLAIDNWPLGRANAAAMQASTTPQLRTVDLGAGVQMQLVRIPAGRFVMGQSDSLPDERPHAVNIDKGFWMGRFEVTNAQFARFDPLHDSRFEDKGSWMFNEWDLGWDLNNPTQPVVRVSWKQAMAFCNWLSEQTGETVTLPTEAQWEWACRAGTDSPLYYGDLDTDFSAWANMADRTIRDLAYDARDNYSPDLIPRDDRFDDGKLIPTSVGQYRPSAWGLHDMHGNVAEWTRSTYAPYPYSDTDGRNDLDPASNKSVRGGSWYDRPKRCRSAFRLDYPAWRKVHNVGFRVVIELDSKSQFAVSR